MVDFNTTGKSMDAAMKTAGEAIANKAKAMDGGNMNEQDLLNMQMDMQKWSLMVNLQSSIVKTMGDTMRGIIQKM